MQDEQFQQIIDDIRNNKINSLNWSNKSLSLEQVLKLAKALEHNTTLTQLDISNNKISAGGADAIAKALEHNTTLTQLHIGSNNIGTDGAEAIAKALEHNTTLTQLNIGSNIIVTDGARAIAKALKHNTTLTQLDIYGNIIGTDGARAIAEALKHNTTLTQLNIDSNKISAGGAEAIAEALEHNTTLTQLHIGNNIIRDDGARAIAKALKHNTTLTQLDIYGNNIDDQTITEELNKLVANNKLPFDKVIGLIEMLELKKAAGKSDGDMDQKSNNVTLEDYAIVCKNERIVNILLKQAHIAGKLKDYSLDKFYSELNLMTDVSALEIGLFKLLDLPKHNIVTASINNKDDKEYNELYNFFTKAELTEDKKDMLKAFKLHYETAQGSNNDNVSLDMLWNRVINYVGQELKWSNEKIDSIKDIDNKIKSEDYTMEQLKFITLFHSLYPEYRQDISLAIEHFSEYIKKGIVASDASVETYDLLKHLTHTILPDKTKAVINEMLAEIHSTKPELFKEPDSLKETRAYTNNNVEHTVEAKSSGKEEEDMDIDNDNSFANVGFSPADIDQAIVNSLHYQDLAVTLSGKDADSYNSSTMEQYALKS
jgi:DNA-binding transcriptional regulator YdaS (Cro superfamily)